MTDDQPDALAEPYSDEVDDAIESIHAWILGKTNRAEYDRAVKYLHSIASSRAMGTAPNADHAALIARIDNTIKEWRGYHFVHLLNDCRTALSADIAHEKEMLARVTDPGGEHPMYDFVADTAVRPEPVAWMYNTISGNYATCNRQELGGAWGTIETPLYAAAPADTAVRDALPREPTKAMIEAAQILVMTASVMGVGPKFEELWTAMYDAALAAPLDQRDSCEIDMQDPSRC